MEKKEFTNQKEDYLLTETYNKMVDYLKENLTLKAMVRENEDLIKNLSEEIKRLTDEIQNSKDVVAYSDIDDDSNKK